MADDRSPADRYADLCVHFYRQGEVSPPERTRGFGSKGLMIGGRLFAMAPRGRLVVKLPPERVSELVAQGVGEHFDANKGVPMKGWLVVNPEHEDRWIALAEEALAYVRSEPPAARRKGRS
jgi:hypothetical protein